MTRPKGSEESVEQVEPPEPEQAPAPAQAAPAQGTVLIEGDQGAMEIPAQGFQEREYVEAATRHAGQEQAPSPPTAVPQDTVPEQRTYLCPSSPGKSFMLDPGDAGTRDVFNKSILHGFRPTHVAQFESGRFTTTDPKPLIARYMRQDMTLEEATAKATKWIRAEIDGIEGSDEFRLGMVQRQDHLDALRVQAEAQQTVQFLREHGMEKEAARVVANLPHLGQQAPPEGVISVEPKLLPAVPRPWDEATGLAPRIPPQPAH